MFRKLFLFTRFRKLDRIQESPKPEQILKGEADEDIVVTEEENKQAQVIGSENNQNRPNLNFSCSVVLTEPHQSKSKLWVLSQRVDETIESGLRKTLGALKNKLAGSIFSNDSGRVSEIFLETSARTENHQSVLEGQKCLSSKHSDFS